MATKTKQTDRQKDAEAAVKRLRRHVEALKRDGVTITVTPRDRR